MKITFMPSAFALLVLLCTPAHAGGVFNTLINNLSAGGHLCGSVRAEHYDAFVRKHSRPRPALEKSRRGLTGLGLFEAHVYGDAIELYQHKTQCVADFSREVLASADAIRELRQTISLVWLNRRKAELLLGQCQLIEAEMSRISLTKVGLPSSHRPEDYAIENLVRRNPQIDPRFHQLCMTSEQTKALRALVVFSERALPFLSSKELLDIVQRHRHVLVSTVTARPLTDQQLLSLDLTSETPQLRYDRSALAAFEQQISRYVRTKLQERLSFQRGLDPARFEEEKFQELYDDHTVDEYFQAAGLTPPVMKADADLNRMVACTRSRYDTSLVGTTLDFVSLFVLARAGLGRSSGFRKLPRLAQEGLAATLASSGHILQACGKKLPTPDVLKASSFDVLGGPHKDHLPGGLDVDLFALSAVSIAEIPSCAARNFDHLYLQRSYAVSCVQEALYAALPATLGLSMMAASVLELQ